MLRLDLDEIDVLTAFDYMHISQGDVKVTVDVVDPCDVRDVEREFYEEVVQELSGQIAIVTASGIPSEISDRIAR